MRWDLTILSVYEDIYMPTRLALTRIVMSSELLLLRRRTEVFPPQLIVRSIPNY